MEQIAANEKVLKCGLKVNLYINQKNQLCMSIRKRKAKNFLAHYSYSSNALRLKSLKQYIKSEIKWNKEKIKRRQARKVKPEKLETIKGGDIFVYSWGYEQTNVQFFQVVDRKGCFVWVREVYCLSVAATSLDSDRVVASKNNFIPDEPILRKKICFTGDTAYLNLSSFGWCCKWEGKEMHRSWGY